MDENIAPRLLGFDEPEALPFIEPFDDAFGHTLPLQTGVDSGHFVLPPIRNLPENKRANYSKLHFLFEHKKASRPFQAGREHFLSEGTY